MRAKLIKLLQEDYDVEIEITDKTRINEDFGFDSLDKVEIAMLIEEEFEIHIEDEEVMNINTFGDLLFMVEMALGYKVEKEIGLPTTRHKPPMPMVEAPKENK